MNSFAARSRRLGAAGIITRRMNIEKLITLREAAQRLAISKRTLEREIAAQRFPKPLKIGRSSRVPEGDLQAYVAALRSERPAVYRAM